MEEKKRDILERTKQFALRIVRLYSALPRTTVAQVIDKQVLRSGTSVGAHVREGKRSRSNAEMVSKTEGALQELEETVYWLELLVESETVKPKQLADLITEADELTAILVASVKTIKRRSEKK
ncbi:MAG: four helix bundle protein [Candidatus Hydrogenedentes bacterium]|nr:four helix bundle protein [Candidatus Hydrogenedentota bacterium]